MPTRSSDGASVFGTVDIVAAATSEDGIEKVEFYVDATRVATVASFPYRHAWDATASPVGPVTLTVVASTPFGAT